MTSRQPLLELSALLGRVRRLNVACRLVDVDRSQDGVDVGVIQPHAVQQLGHLRLDKVGPMRE